jgi:predicted GIY-YIG superfamily endonuclease
MPRPTIGTVYLLHFDTPLKHARHYTGWSANLSLRLAEHASGHGARLTEVVAGLGIGWSLARTWPNVTRAYERKLKNQGGASRRCPLCGIKPRIAQPQPVIALPEWTEVHHGGAIRFEAECASCHQVRGMFDFDLSRPDRHVCLDCLEPAAPALIGAC